MDPITSVLTRIAAEDMRDGVVMPSTVSVAQLSEAVRNRAGMAAPDDGYYQRPDLKKCDGWASADPTRFVEAASAFLLNTILSGPRPSNASTLELVCQNQIDNHENQRGERIKLSLRWR